MIYSFLKIPQRPNSLAFGLEEPFLRVYLRPKAAQDDALNGRKNWAVVVVKWSACSPPTLIIRVRLMLTPRYSYERTKIKQKEAVGWAFYRRTHFRPVYKEDIFSTDIIIAFRPK